MNEMVAPGKYNGVRCLVTGHTGFKGSWLCEWLLAEGADVAGLALAPEAGTPSNFADLGLAERTRSTFGDIRSFGTVEACMAAFQPEIIFHLAAQALVRRSYADPVGTFATNVMGSVHVLEAARRQCSVRAVVYVTSDKCYANKEWVWGYRESDPLGGKDPYSASKGAAEIIAGSYLQTIFPEDGRVLLATARGGNVIGGGDWSEDRLVPDLARAMAAGRPMVIRNPGALRPWQHVLELVHGYLMLGARLLDGDRAAEGSWNFGPNRENEVTVDQLSRAFSEYWGGDRDFELVVVPSPLKEAHFLKLDISKACDMLGWSPRLNFTETVRTTVDWYRGYSEDPSSGRGLLQEQLRSFRAGLMW